MSILNQIMSGQAAKITPVQTQSQTGKNPFMVTQSYQGAAKEDMGVNRPLRTPMFFGYKDNKAVYAGSRLFVLY